MDYKIYSLSDSSGKVRYVGQTRQKLSHRFYQHKYAALNNNLNYHKDNWLRKELINGNTIKINLVEYCEQEELDTREQFWINYYISIGANMTNTQVVGSRRYDCGKQKWSDEHIKYLQQKSTEFALEKKLNKAILQYNLSGEFIQEFPSISDALKYLGKRKRKIGRLIKLTTSQNQRYGFMWREKAGLVIPLQIKPFRSPYAKKVAQYTLTDEYVTTHETIKAAAKSTGKAIRSHIASCCIGKLKQSAGFKWKFID